MNKKRSFMKKILLTIMIGLFCMNAEASTIKTLDSGLKVQDNNVGAGVEAVSGKQVSVHYTGWLSDNGKKGKKFDSSVDRGKPFAFMLGGGQVIKGWDEGVAGMKIGGKRTLIIPAKLGYGPHGAGAVIPPNAELIFDVELLEVK
jgi:FKBP-type peptidyl-prolyl cis-trans isomerase